jgi:hypothetical protein
MSKRKTLAIVTCTLNGDPAVTDTARSLLPQIDESVEWLIKNSSEGLPDHMREIIACPGVNFVSEPDSSLYEGLNQAIVNITAEHFMVLGAGDVLMPGSINTILAAIRQYPQVGSYFFALNSKANKDQIFFPTPERFDTQMGAAHPATIVKTDNCRQLGGFDCTYKIAADYDFMSRYLKTYTTFVKSNSVIVTFKGGGISEKRGLEALLEEEIIRLRVWKCNPLQTAVKLRAIAQMINKLSEC